MQPRYCGEIERLGDESSLLNLDTGIFNTIIVPTFKMITPPNFKTPPPKIDPALLVSIQPLSQPQSTCAPRHTYRTYTKEKFGSTHSDIQNRAYKLWENDGAIEGADDKYYWEKAKRELTPEIQLAIENELPDWIISCPGPSNDWPYQYKYSSVLEEDPRLLSYGRLHTNGIYELTKPGIARMLQSYDSSPQKFDINSQESLEELLEYITNYATHVLSYDRALLRFKNIQHISRHAISDNGMTFTRMGDNNYFTEI